MKTYLYEAKDFMFDKSKPYLEMHKEVMEAITEHLNNRAKEKYDEITYFEQLTDKDKTTIFVVWERKK